MAALTASALRRALAGVAWLLAAAAPLAAAASEVLERSFRSTALQTEMRYTVYLPDGYAETPRRYPVLYLLHGHGGNERDWLTHGALQATADRLIRCRAVSPFIAVMPAGGSTWWVDSKAAPAQRALVHGLLPHVDATLRTLPTRQGRMIAGLSAGGYGAVMAVLQHADRFAAAAAFSPAAYVPEPPADSGARQAGAFAVGGRFDPATWQRLNYPAAWPAYAAGAHVVPMFLHSGDHDHLGIALQTALLFQRLFVHQPRQVELRIVDGGHDWAVWRSALVEALPFLMRHAAADVSAASAAPASTAAACTD